jgi:hypothetical protein
MYLCDIDFVSFYIFFYIILELFRQCGIFVFVFHFIQSIVPKKKKPTISNCIFFLDLVDAI